MNAFLETMTAATIPLAVGVIGYLLLRRRILPETSLPVLAVLSIDVALPAQVFSQLIGQFDPAVLTDWWQSPLWWGVFTLWTAGLSWAGCLPFRRCRREVMACLFYPNAIFIPIIILTELDGAGSIRLTGLFLFTLFYPAFLFTTAPRILGQANTPLPWRHLITPVFIATLAGIVIRLLEVHHWIPGWTEASLRVLGSITVPVLLLYLGAVIAVDIHQGGPSPRLGNVIGFVVIKNVLFPLLTLPLLMLRWIPAETAFLMALISAVPPVTALPILAQRAGADQRLINQFLVGSFIASVVTLPATVAAFAWLRPPGL